MSSTATTTASSSGKSEERSMTALRRFAARRSTPPAAASLRRLDSATGAVVPPLAAVDLDALDANARFLVAAAGGLPIRVASKSIRCVELIAHVLREHPGFRGVLAFTPDVACHLAPAGIYDMLLA